MTRGPQRSVRLAAELDLEPLDAFEQRLGLEARPAERAGVDEPVLVGLAPGRGAVEAGDRGQFDLRLARDRAQRPAQALGFVADIAAEREDDARFSVALRLRRERGRGGGLERREDGERRAVFDDVVHAQHRSSSHERDRVGGERAGEPPIDLRVNDPADERLAGEPDQDRRSEVFGSDRDSRCRHGSAAASCQSRRRDRARSGQRARRRPRRG